MRLKNKFKVLKQLIYLESYLVSMLQQYAVTFKG